MSRPLHIALLELNSYLRNRGELAFSIALPIVLFALMYGAFGGEESFHATANVVDLDGGAHARSFIEQLDALDEITVKERTLQDADAALDRSAILMAVVIPAGFSATLDSGAAASLVFKQRGHGGQTGQIVASIVQAVSQEIGGDIQIRRLVNAALDDSGASTEQIATATDNVTARSLLNPPLRVEVRQLDGEQPNILDRMVPGMVVMFLMFAVTMSAQTLVEERRIGTLERLMTTRLGVNQLFAGKFISGMLRAMVQALVLLSLAFAVLRVGDAVDFTEMLLLSALVAAAVSAVSLVIGAFARTRDQATWAAVVFTMFMTVFGGTFFDVSAGPLALLSKFTINGHAIDAMASVLSAGESLAQQGLQMAIMMGVTIVGLAAARALFKVTEGGR